MPKKSRMPTTQLRFVRYSGELGELRRASRRSTGCNFNVWLGRNENSSDFSEPKVTIKPSSGFSCVVTRNRARRRTRGCIMELREEFEPGLWYLIEFKPGVESENYQLLVNELKETLKRVRTCNGNHLLL